MFYELKDFPFLQNLVDNVDKVTAELNNLRANNTVLDKFFDYPPDTPLTETTSHVEYWIKESGIHPDQIGYEARKGEWVAFPLYKKGFPIKWLNMQEAFPFTMSQIMETPGVNFSALFRIAPNSGSNEHAHSQSNFIFHLCLYDLDNDSEMICDGKKKILRKKGDWCIFNYSKPHSSFNYSTKDRVNLIIDFNPANV